MRILGFIGTLIYLSWALIYWCLMEVLFGREAIE